MSSSKINIDNKEKKHIVYFPGLTYTFEKEPDEDKGEWNWAAEAGMDVHFINFPGSGKSKGNSLNGQNRVNAGIEVISDLLKQGIRPNNIVLYGSCAGGLIAAETYKRFKDDNVHLRCIINKSFSSFKKLIVKLLHVSKPKWLFPPIIKFILKCFGWHFKPHTIINDITPYTICFNLENDGFINKKATIGAKIADIETSDRKKDYQKKEIFEGFEEYKEFFIEHTNLTKIPKTKNPEPKVGVIKKCWNKFLSLLPIKADDIHFSPITELCSSNEHNYTLPELISLFLELTDNYFEKKVSLKQEHEEKPSAQEQGHKVCSEQETLISEVGITKANPPTINSMICKT
ncbi:alpha/beta hydrolase [Wolbachia endosymbiont of Ctenocephalides felis wCfeJ]|uniref:alpha/beta hydrolase n=1 Tax=Wolbachia endosymbiont of Ctenocephalides felis wCfeJ TaxID=2732594 RepID=UPI001FE44D18|nr:alpha/beta hydrolase [Wolbachia endosymbiont of Ctenocephalides felis wCfeJ]